MYKILLLIMLVTISSCKKNNDIKLVFDNENSDMIEKTKELIDEFGFTNYLIKTYYHRSIGNVPSSKTIKSIRAVGDGLLPVLESVSDYDPVAWDGYIKTFSNNFNGYFEQKIIATNYDHQRGRNLSITYDYISLLIIFDEITPKQRDELLKILNMYIGNANRGDTIYIASKKLLEE